MEKGLVNYWTTEHKRWHERPVYNDLMYEHYLNRIFPNPKGMHILEIGCGDAHTMKYFLKKGSKVKGIDIIDKTVKGLKKEGLDVIKADTRKLPFKNNTFDLVYSWGVVEHFDETVQALKEHIRVAKKGSDIIFSVPNRATPYTILETLWHVVKGTQKYGIASNGKRYTLKEMREMVKELAKDYKIKTVKIMPCYTCAFLQAVNFPWLDKVSVNVEKFFDNIMPVKSFFSQMIWVHVKKL